MRQTIPSISRLVAGLRFLPDHFERELTILATELAIARREPNARRGALLLEPERAAVDHNEERAGILEDRGEFLPVTAAKIDGLVRSRRSDPDNPTR